MFEDNFPSSWWGIAIGCFVLFFSWLPVTALFESRTEWSLTMHRKFPILYHPCRNHIRPSHLTRKSPFRGKMPNNSLSVGWKSGHLLIRSDKLYSIGNRYWKSDKKEKKSKSKSLRKRSTSICFTWPSLQILLQWNLDITRGKRARRTGEICLL